METLTIIQNIPFFQSKDIVNIKSITGGSINHAYRIETPEEIYFIKLNSRDKFPDMMKTEALGLKFLSQASRYFIIPSVLDQGDIQDMQYLILDFITPGQKEDYSAFAKALYQLHTNTSDYFGLNHDNYIGSLPQPNGRYKSAGDYYISSRLEPQFKLANDNGFDFPGLDDFYGLVNSVIPDNPPAAIHGDLWSGNHMFDKAGKPVLIDPAVSYGIAEMDLAMMKLFGGFPKQVFKEYERLSNLDSPWKVRIPLYQLYYLLVHLNIFGSGYFSQVSNAINAVRKLT